MGIERMEYPVRSVYSFLLCALLTNRPVALLLSASAGAYVLMNLFLLCRDQAGEPGTLELKLTLETMSPPAGGKTNLPWRLIMPSTDE